MLNTHDESVALPATTCDDTRIHEYIGAIERITYGQYQIDEIPLEPQDQISLLGLALLNLSKNIEMQHRQLDAISEITTQINSGLVLEDILDNVYEQFRNLIPYNRIGFSLIKKDENQRTIVKAIWAKSDSNDVKLTKGYSALLEGSTLAQIIETGKPRIIPDLVAYAAHKPNSESSQLILQEGIRSSLTCPLISNGNPIGFMFFSSNQRNTYSEAHIAIFQRIAAELSVILEKGRLISEIMEQRKAISEQNERLRELNDLKNTFLGIAAHDLRNPLANIQLAASLLMMDDPTLTSDERKLILEDVHNQSKFMTTLLSDLLDVTQIESGQLQLKPVSIDVASFITEIVENHRKLATMKSTTITLENIDEGYMLADRNKIRQVVDNLLSNAVKYSPPSSNVVISVDFSNQCLKVSVRDAGPGITPEDRKKLFKDFAKLSARPTGGERSIGLGLSIARRIVEAHGGEIGVDSEPGAGSTFWFTLPSNVSVT